MEKVRAWLDPPHAVHVRPSEPQSKVNFGRFCPCDCNKGGMPSMEKVRARRLRGYNSV
jgi:hypothetical protein